VAALVDGGGGGDAVGLTVCGMVRAGCWCCVLAVPAARWRPRIDAIEDGRKPAQCWPTRLSYLIILFFLFIYLIILYYYDKPIRVDPHPFGPESRTYVSPLIAICFIKLLWTRRLILVMARIRHILTLHQSLSHDLQQLNC
jgi:hypothetical protein